MRLLRTAVVVSAISLLLTGCASPLDPDDVTISLSVDAPADVVVGDEIELVVDVDLADDRTDVVTIVVEQLADGGWQPVVTVDEAGPRIRVEHRELVDEEEPGDFRAVVLAPTDDAEVLATSSSIAITAVDVTASIEQHFADRNAAYAASTQAGLDFDQRAVVPGFFDADAPGAAAFALGQLEGAYNEVVEPDLGSVRESEPFIWPGDNCTEQVNIGTLGRPFLVSVTVTTRYAQFTDTIMNEQTVIVSGGRLYSFVSNCA